ncbi:MAG: peptidylprolyl isomerase [Candidatus Rokubacteria bacterium]|nr:peptidylprolyl isomerase [Candidatus Rokubacteria bacterium]
MRFAFIVLLAVLAPCAVADAQGGKAPTLVMTMEKGGQVTIELWPDVAPNHVKNFVDLSKQGFYDGQRVHRVEPKFVVQFGDPASKTKPMDDPAMGSGGSGKTLKAEFNKKPFDRGVLGMARTNDPDSASSQVYLMLGDAHFLNGQYTAFGKVTKGMEVVDKIKVGDRIKSITAQ